MAEGHRKSQGGGEPASVPGPKLLLVEDDPAVRASLVRRLKFEGFEIIPAETGEEALTRFREEEIDLILLDVMLPTIDGFTVAERIREASHVPILMLTAKDSVEDRVAGLMRGADDYLVKPFEMPELIARLRALLRRAQLQGSGGATQEEPEVLSFAGITLESKTREVEVDGRPVELTPREFELLAFFLAHPRQVLTRDQILEAVWGYDADASSNLVDVYVRQLRKKFESDGVAGDRRLQTVRGVGYSLREPI